MPRPSVDVDALILEIHAASLSQDEWPVIMRRLMGLVGAESALMHSVSIRTGGLGSWGLSQAIDPSFWPEVARRWAPQDPFRIGAARAGRIRPGCVSVGEQLVQTRELLSSAFYNELLKRVNIHWLLNICLCAPGATSDIAAALSFYRGSGQEPFSAAEAGALHRLAPHLVVATRNFFQAQSLLHSGAVKGDALDTLSAAVLAIDGSARLVLANRQAEALLKAGALLRLNAGLLCPGRQLCQPAAFASALAQLRQGLGATVLLTDARTGIEWVASLAPAAHSGPADHMAGLIWLLPTAPDAGPVPQMARLFELTPAEQRVLERLVAGEELGEAAAALGVAVSTARNQLSSIFRKTGRHSQALLLQLVARMAVIAPG